MGVCGCQDIGWFVDLVMAGLALTLLVALWTLIVGIVVGVWRILKG